MAFLLLDLSLLTVVFFIRVELTLLVLDFARLGVTNLLLGYLGSDVSESVSSSKVIVALDGMILYSLVLLDLLSPLLCFAVEAGVVAYYGDTSSL